MILTNRSQALGEYARNKAPIARVLYPEHRTLRGAVQYPSPVDGSANWKVQHHSWLSNSNNRVRLPLKGPKKITTVEISSLAIFVVISMDYGEVWYSVVLILSSSSDMETYDSSDLGRDVSSRLSVIIICLVSRTKYAFRHRGYILETRFTQFGDSSGVL